ncbi:efflux RND transporter periplasmic adaptor subunit [Pendulispora rubella]|uniref:Efflux RND transporter periplasmic adaptor subunit n=1 Tax=Pendulispora rubella TaxID=2741070 RepID=A0ABZ2LKB5_9BACT
MSHRLFVLVALVLLIACKKEEPAPPKSAGGAPRGARGATAFAVDVMPVQSKTVDYIVQAPGTLEAFERVEVTARVAGVVDKVAFTDGQNVKKGDVLVVIDSERYQLAVNSAKAGLEKVQASQRDVEAMVARRQGASDAHPGLIPGEELETYKTKTLTAKADTAVATEALKVAQLNLRDAFVRAPIEGTIQTRTVETGQYVNTGYLMATLLRADPLLLRFQVDPENAVRLKPGMAVNFSIRETQNEYKAKISLVAGAADPATHTVAVTAQVDADSKRYWLRPGSFCDVTIDVGARREAPVIPRAATRATDHGYVVYVIEGDAAAEKVVTLGMNTKDGWVEIRNGLSAGELLVVRGVESMSNGARVTANKVDSLDASAPEVPLDLDAGARDRDGGKGGGGKRRGAGDAAP